MANALELVDELFTHMIERDKDAVLALFTDDAVLVDPHYPKMEMRGRRAIEKGLKWGFASMEQFGFTIVSGYSSEDGASAAVEVDTHHTLKGGQTLEFPQAFFANATAGKLTGLRAYEPYRPNGIGGFFLRLSHIPAHMPWY